MRAAVAVNSEYAGLITPLATLVGVVVGFLIMLRILRRRHPTRVRAMNFQVRSMTGPNAALVLAAVSAAKLLFEIGRIPGGLAAAVVGGLVIVVGLVVAPSMFEALVGVGGLVAFVMLTGIDDGPEQAAWYLAIAVTMLVALGVARGMRQPRR